MKRLSLRILSVVLVIVLISVLIPPINVRAEGNKSVLDINTIVISEWEEGYQAEVRISNNSDNPVSDWTFVSDINGIIVSCWNAVTNRNDDGTYSFSNESWNGEILPHSEVSVGYIVNYINESDENDVENHVEEEDFDNTNSDESDEDTEDENSSEISDEELQYSRLFQEDFYEVFYEVSDDWDGGYNVVVEIKNLSEDEICLWTLELETNEEIVDLYNACIEFDDGVRKKFAGLEWNQDIPVGSAVSFGYTVRSDYIEPPKSCSLYFSKETVKEESYTLTYYSNPVWEDGFTGYLTITNISEEDINDWVLEFDFEEEIDEIWNAQIVEHVGIHYVLTNAGYSRNIKVGDSLIIGFNVRNSKGSYSVANSILHRFVYSNSFNGTKNVLELDSDGDGLSDFYEEHVTFTNPKIQKTDGYNPDGDRDEDKDGLTNLEEYLLSSNAFMDDTDNDGLKDYEEVYVYHTNPCEYDSDFDGVGDWTEVNRGTDPLNPDSNGDGISDGEEDISFRLCDNQYESLRPDVLGYSVDIEITGKGDYNNKLIIEEGRDWLLPGIEYMVGEPISIEHDELEFQHAEMVFTISDEILNNCSIENIGIASYDENTHKIEFLETSIVSSNQVKCTTTHFSLYFLVDKSLLGLYFLSPAIDEKKTMCDVSFVIDTTGSMGSAIYNTKNSVSKVADLTKELNMDVRFGLVEFKDITEDNFPSKNYGWFDTCDDFKSTLDLLSAGGGGDWEESAVDALEKARCSEWRRFANKSIVLITDAPYKTETEYSSLSSMEEIRRLNLSGITVYVITSSGCVNIYKTLTEETGGREYDLYDDYAVSLIEMFTQEHDKAKLYHWVRLADGTIVKLLVDPETTGEDDPSDTDGDGIPDMKELLGKTSISCGGEIYTVWEYDTNPAINDLFVDSHYNKNPEIITVYELYDAIKLIESVYSSSFIQYIKANSLREAHTYEDISSLYRYMSNDSVLLFLSDEKYNKPYWKYLLGDNSNSYRYNVSINESSLGKDKKRIIDACEYAEKKVNESSSLEKYRRITFTDPISGEGVDIMHLAASCGAHYNQKTNVGIYPIELSSWGGDLQTFAVDMFGDGKIDTYLGIETQFNRLFARDGSTSSFSKEDLLGDVDGVILSVNIQNKMISTAVKDYYVDGGVLYRYSKFLEHYGNRLNDVLNQCLPDDSFSLDNQHLLENRLSVPSETKIPFTYHRMIKTNKRRLPTVFEIDVLKDCFRSYIMRESEREMTQ